MATYRYFDYVGNDWSASDIVTAQKHLRNYAFGQISYEVNRDLIYEFHIVEERAMRYDNKTMIEIEIAMIARS